MVTHGHFDIDHLEDTLLLTFRGGIDAEKAQTFLQKFIQQASTITRKPWAMIVVLRPDTVGTPDAEKYWRQFCQICYSKGMSHAAHVGPHVVTVDQIRRLVSDIPIELGFFDFYDEASSWLQKCGFTVKRNQE